MALRCGASAVALVAAVVLAGCGAADVKLVRRGEHWLIAGMGD